MTLALDSPSAETISRLLSVLAVLSASAAAFFLLFPGPLADAFFAGWVLFGVGLALVGAVAAWRNWTPLVWVAAVLSVLLSVAGAMSIGVFVAPTALFLLGSAVFSRAAGPRPGVGEAILADPPTAREAVLKALAGIGSVAVGAGLVYAGAFTQHLFGACARETLACALEKTRWGAVGVTVLGLLAVCLGGWLLWKQIYVARVLASTRAG